jgi:hypothetical protein
LASESDPGPIEAAAEPNATTCLLLLDLDTILSPQPALFHEEIGEGRIRVVDSLGFRPGKLIAIDDGLDRSEHGE